MNARSLFLQRFITKETLAYEMSKENSIDIDTEMDFKKLEMIITKK